MSPHTKGPWSVNEWSGGWIVYGGRLPLVAGVEVARVSPVDNERERNEADARLIAAAPELLAALRRIASNAYVGATSDTLIPAEIARAAIAKAQGGE